MMSFEWTENGRELLRNINGEINKNGGIVATYHTLVLENSHIYAELKKAKRSFYENQYKLGKRKLIKIPKPYKRTPYSNDELKIIFDNLHLKPLELRRLLPTRSYDAVRIKAHTVRKNYDFIKLLLSKK